MSFEIRFLVHNGTGLFSITEDCIGDGEAGRHVQRALDKRHLSDEEVRMVRAFAQQVVEEFDK